MKILNKSLTTILIIFFTFMFVACNTEFNPEIVLSDEQQIIYSQVEEYALSCSESELKDYTLHQIKSDIKKSSNDKLDLELSIAKLRIDKLILKDKLDADILSKQMTAAKNKTEYKNKRDNITNKYYGTESSYNYEIANLNNIISQAYADYKKECNSLNGSNLGTGFITEYKRQAYQKYQSISSSCNVQISQLKTQWQNKLNYDNYNKLYNEVDAKLEKDIESLQNKYQYEHRKNTSNTNS